MTKKPSIKATAKQEADVPDIACFFMASALAIYEREGALKQRHLNVLLQSDTPQLTRKDLGTMNRTVLQRLQAENEVSPDMVKDVVFMSISPLGMMPPSVFHGEPDPSEPPRPS